MKNIFKNKELRGIPRFFIGIISSIVLSALFALISRIGLPYLVENILKLPFFLIIIISFIALAVFIFSVGTLPYTFRGVGLPGPSGTIQAILSLVAILLFLWAIPALIIYWIVNPNNLKKAIMIGVLLSSISLSLVYYLSNRKKFKTPADIVSFFSGVCLGPVAVMEVLL